MQIKKKAYMSRRAVMFTQNILKSTLQVGSFNITYLFKEMLFFNVDSI